MKINRQFAPITITFEYKEDVDKFLKVLRAAMRGPCSGPIFNREKADEYQHADYLYRKLTD